MSIKSVLSRCLALILVLAIGLTGCNSSATGLTGNYRDDTLMVLQNLTEAIELPQDAPNKSAVIDVARDRMNEYAARYRRDSNYAGLSSFTTMQTAVNSLAGYYSSYGSRPLPEKLKKRLQQEFRRVEIALKRGA
ncbi:MAG: photosystem II protein Psb27 [Jaaginema sp. PMC 1079.18]|nr:photosystem II protein Psb27 [Jaaginema sp. PMC 1080.18]MEC4853224.1 photosystem II protein Psb27 [Jaaginema sp. PMC 1079.18]MEC4868555.1 photosystem II protein Psb27 [Jaaginema sp. PMC 1078.18]